MSGGDPIDPESQRAFRTLELVTSIQLQLSDAQGFDEPLSSVVIGGYALGLHGIERVTSDIDLAVSTGDFYMHTRHVRARLELEGYEVTFREAGDDDPLGGVCDVFREDIHVVQIVNMYSPASVGLS